MSECRCGYGKLYPQKCRCWFIDLVRAARAALGVEGKQGGEE